MVTIILQMFQAILNPLNVRELFERIPSEVGAFIFQRCHFVTGLCEVICSFSASN